MAAAEDPAYCIHPDAEREGTAKTPSVDARGVSRLRDPGMGVTEGESFTLGAGKPPSVVGPGHGEAHEPKPDGPRYAAMGNAVSVPVIEWIGRRLVEFG